MLAQVRPGFAVLADLSGLEAMDVECGPHIAKIMDLCKARGVSLVVRVMPDPKKDIGLNILSLVHYRGKVKIVTCATRAEAEHALAS
jgi:anti-anti-sigma regulatory factor